MPELSQLFWYKPIFMTELLIAEALFAVRLKRRSLFPLRLAAALALCYGVSFALPAAFFNPVYCSFLFVSLFFVSVLMMKFCFRESWINILFSSIAGYTTQHIAFELYDLIVNLADLNGGQAFNFYGSEVGSVYAPFADPLTALIYLFDYIIVYWSSFMIFGRRISKNEPLKLKNTAVMILVALIVLIDILLTSMITYYSEENFDSFYTRMLCVFNLICCVLALYVQFELPLRKKLEDELTIINHLRAQEEKQYTFSRENIELINLKCHDLKHQIRQIGNVNAMNGAVIAEMENIISIYDSAVKTGNRALDIILTEKSLLCNKQGIKLSCIVDGAKLNFMSEIDLYSLFGNILDNAMEAVAGLEEDKRVIGITVKGVRDFVSINVHNYYDKELVFEAGLPKTTKTDEAYHGFGMKSIDMTCKKYGGDVSVRASDHVFNLSVLFPLSDVKNKNMADFEKVMQKL